MENRIIGENASITEFCESLGSSMPAPGGGGAAALCAALGTCLMRMVGSLTVGKKKYAQYESEIITMMDRCTEASKRFLGLIEKDALDFLPLAEAYAIPKDNPERESIIEQATLTAIKAPLETLELLRQVCDMLQEFCEKGSRLAVSDVGCAAALVRSAAESAILNVYINTKTLKDREQAESLNEHASVLLDEISKHSNSVYEAVSKELKGEARD